MSRYRTYGKLDDPYVEEGDTFFNRMNNRVPTIPASGWEVQLSENGRMDIDELGNLEKG